MLENMQNRKEFKIKVYLPSFDSVYKSEDGWLYAIEGVRLIVYRSDDFIKRRIYVGIPYTIIYED